MVEPFYTNYNAFAAMAGVRLVPLTSRGEDGFHLPPRAAWDAAVTPSTRMVILRLERLSKCRFPICQNARGSCV